MSPTVDEQPRLTVEDAVELFQKTDPHDIDAMAPRIGSLGRRDLHEVANRLGLELTDSEATMKAYILEKILTKKMDEKTGDGKKPEEDIECIIYGYRWVQLSYLSLLAMLSDLVCFAIAAEPFFWEEYYEVEASQIIDIFLFTNVASCFAEPFIVQRYGMRKPIVISSILMAIGCLCRSGIPFIGDLVPYSIVVIGTICVGAAQPFFQCTPPLLSAHWFPPHQRASSTAIAINFNQVGIALAFVMGGEMGGTEEGLKLFFSIITIASILLAVGTTLQFREKPPTPPSASAAEHHGEQKYFPMQAKQYFMTKGFLHPLFAFITSIAITNVVGSFIAPKLIRCGVTDQRTINFAGAGFEIAIVVGGVVLGGYVDHTKKYKKVSMFCLLVSLVTCAVLGLPHLPQGFVIFVLVLVGFFCGPVQPINAELAVDVTYPSDENAIEAIQQLIGNLLSAVLLPICTMVSDESLDLQMTHVYGDTVMLIVLITLCMLFYATFNAPLKRTAIDCKWHGHDIDDDPFLKVTQAIIDKVKYEWEGRHGEGHSGEGHPGEIKPIDPEQVEVHIVESGWPDAHGKKDSQGKRDAQGKKSQESPHNGLRGTKRGSWSCFDCLPFF